MSAVPAFSGFTPPTANFTQIPNEFFDLMPEFKSMAEMKIVMYVIRHTWGFQTDKRRLSVDEIMRGRKKSDGTRMDSGTGLSKQSVINGCDKAVEHGFLTVIVDAKDRARIQKFYMVKSLDNGNKNCNSGVKDLDPDVKDLDPGGLNVRPRTEKETKEKNLRKKDLPSGNGEPQKTLSDSVIENVNQDQPQNKTAPGTQAPNPPVPPPPLPPSGKELTPHQAMYSAVAEVYGFKTSLTGKIAKLARSAFSPSNDKKKDMRDEQWIENNLPEAMTPEQFVRWGKWYKSKYDGFDLPKNPEKISTSLQQYLSEKQSTPTRPELQLWQPPHDPDAQDYSSEVSEVMAGLMALIDQTPEDGNEQSTA